MQSVNLFFKLLKRHPSKKKNYSVFETQFFIFPKKGFLKRGKKAGKDDEYEERGY